MVRRDLVVLTRTRITDPRTVPVLDLGDPAGGPVLDLPHPDPAALDRFPRRRRIPVDGLLWLPEGGPVPAEVAAAFAEDWRLTVETHTGWRPALATAPGPAQVVKQVSFLAAADGYGTERFRAHYRDHVALAQRLMPTVFQYAQNDVVASTARTPAAEEVVAVSELWFRLPDFLAPHFRSDEEGDEFRSHEGFLDLSKAVTVAMASHRLPTQEP
jgi:hypothetical protein